MKRASLDPQAWDVVRAQGHLMLDDMIDYLSTLDERPVWQSAPPEVKARFSSSLPDDPTPLDEVYHEFSTCILPYTVGNIHPRFMGWVQGGGTVVGMLAEMLSAGLNANVGGRAQIPLDVERQIVRWMADVFGFPQTASGLCLTGTSMANLLAVLVARQRSLGSTVRDEGVGEHRLVAYTSQEAHGCIKQAFDLSGLGRHTLRLVPTDAEHRMDALALINMIHQDTEAGRHPFFIAATVGTVDVGAIDPLETLVSVAKTFGLWLHVDGAYGALAALSKELAPRLKGLDQVDSIAFDFHKWGQVPYDAGFILMRDQQHLLDTFASQAAYLSRGERGLFADSPWSCDLGPDLSRGFRALKIWFTLKTYGLQALGASIFYTCELALYLKKRIEATPELVLLAPVELNIVCFRYRCDDNYANQLNSDIVMDLHESGIAVPSTTMLGDTLAIRVAIVNHRTTQMDIDTMLNAVLDIGKIKVDQINGNK